MSFRTIRVDEAVYDWLSKQATGFDTPNDVLRRLFGLPAEPSLTSSATKVLDMLPSDADVDTAEIVRATGLGSSTVTRALAALESEGLARRTKGERGGRGAGRGAIPDKWRRTDAGGRNDCTHES